MRFLAKDERWFLALCAAVLLAQAGRAVTCLAGGWWGPYVEEAPRVPAEGGLGLVAEPAR
jgi:hypothetical protein